MKQVFIFLCMMLISSVIFASETITIPILCYHNLNPSRPGSMNMTPRKFESQLQLIKNLGLTVIPLQEAVEYLRGERDSLPPRPIVITADDGWQSAYTYMVPLMKKYHYPLTLFIYPEAISQGRNNMTWQELKELQQTGLVDIQGHTYSHPNFKQERRHRSPESYDKFVKHELGYSKQVLENQLNKKISYLAWPFGIYDPYLEQAAKNAGYEMSFTIDARAAKKTDNPMAVARFMIVDGLTPQTFMGILKRAH